MGLIKEPNNVDFTVLDKNWTDKEANEFSEFIKLRKRILKNEISKANSSFRKQTVI